MMCHSIGRPPTSIMGFGRKWDSSLIRVPNPPARMTVFTKNLPEYFDLIRSYTLGPYVTSNATTTHEKMAMSREHGHFRQISRTSVQADLVLRRATKRPSPPINIKPVAGNGTGAGAGWTRSAEIGLELPLNCPRNSPLSFAFVSTST